jgi:sulfoxide reductase heme-binding subunit YedZ
MMKWKFTPLQIAVHIGAWIPLAWLVWAYMNRRLTVNPFQNATQRTGKDALVMLVLCLACTPLNTLFGWRGVLRVKRTLGLYAFLYATIHVLILSGLDYHFNFSFLYADFHGKLYIWAGVVAWLILLVLAITAFRWAMKRLGKSWKRLHQLIYLSGVLVVLHYAWAKKGDLFHLRGDIRQPLYFGLLVILLLALRIPPIERGTKKLRASLSGKVRRYGQHIFNSWMYRLFPVSMLSATIRRRSRRSG